MHVSFDQLCFILDGLFLILFFQYGCKKDLANRLRYARNIVQKLMVSKSTVKPSVTTSTVSQESQPTTAWKV